MLRIGINLGDVIIEGDDIYGDGVNIAARLEPLAEPGGVCVSSIVNESVGNRIDARFQDGGDVSVKNIDRPIQVWKWHPGATVANAPAKPQPNVPTASIAVLPFTNMSGDPDQEYFSDGISEDIITDLSKIAGLTVIARNSSFTFKGRSVDVRTVGRDLGVRSAKGLGRLGSNCQDFRSRSPPPLVVSNLLYFCPCRSCRAKSRPTRRPVAQEDPSHITTWSSYLTPPPTQQTTVFDHATIRPFTRDIDFTIFLVGAPRVFGHLRDRTEKNDVVAIVAWGRTERPRHNPQAAATSQINVRHDARTQNAREVGDNGRAILARDFVYQSSGADDVAAFEH